MLGASAGALLTYIRCRTLILASGSPPSSHKTLARAASEHCTMKALIVSRDPSVFAVFSQLLEQMDVDPQRCESELVAIQRLTSERFDALILDFDGIPGCADVGRRVRGIRPNQEIAVFAIASGEANKRLALGSGTTFAVEQPLVASRLKGILLTAYGRMVKSSQAYFRFNIELEVSVTRENGPSLQCQTINLSQTGMAILAPARLRPGEKLKLTFVLPDTGDTLNAEGTVIWDDGHGKAGMRFECPNESAKIRYSEWLQGQFFIRVGRRSRTIDYDPVFAH